MASTTSQFERLIEELRTGSEDAARQLLEEYGPGIQRVVRRKLERQFRRRFDSQDVMQALWLSFFDDREAIAKFESPEQLKAYLVGMAKNKVANNVRRVVSQKRGYKGECSLERDLTASDAPLARGCTPSEAAVAKEEWEQLLKGHAPHEQKMLYLRGGGASSGEIAKEMGMPSRTVLSTIKRLIKRFGL